MTTTRLLKKRITGISVSILLLILLPVLSLFSGINSSTRIIPVQFAGAPPTTPGGNPITVSDAAGVITLTISPAGVSITDMHTTVSGNTLIITAVNSSNMITLSPFISAGITSDYTSTITVNLDTYPQFSGIAVVGGTGSDLVTIGPGGIDLGAVSGGAANQSLRFDLGTSNDQLTISNPLKAKNSGNIFLRSGLGYSINSVINADSLTLISNGTVNQSVAVQATHLVLGKGTRSFSCFDTIQNNGNYHLDNDTNDVASLSVCTSGTVSYKDVSTLFVNGMGGKANGDFSLTARGRLEVKDCGIVNPNSTGTITLISEHGAVVVSAYGIQSGGNVFISSADSNIYITGSGVSCAGNFQATCRGNFFSEMSSINTTSGSGNINLSSTNGTITSAGNGLQSKGKITLTSYNDLTAMQSGINNNYGTGVDLTSEHGSVVVKDAGVRTMGSLKAVAAHAVTIEGTGIDATYGSGDVSVTSSADSVTIRNNGVLSKGNISVISDGNIIITGSGISNFSGKGVTLTSSNGRIMIDGGGVSSKGPVHANAYRSLTITGTGINNTMGVDSLWLSSTTDSVLINSGGLQSKGKITVLSNGNIHSFGSINNSNGKGVALTSSNGEIKIANTGLSSRGPVHATANRGLYIYSINNTMGTDSIWLTSSSDSVVIAASGIQSNGKVTVLSNGDIHTSGVCINNPNGKGVTLTSNNGGIKIEDGGVNSGGPVRATASKTLKVTGINNSMGTDSVWLTSTTDSVVISLTGIQSNGKITILSNGNIHTSCSINNSTGKGVTLTSNNGGIKIEGSGVMSKGPVHATAYRALRLTGGGIVNTMGTDSVWLTSTADSVAISGSGIQSNGTVTVSSYGDIHASNGAINNLNGKGVTLTSTNGAMKFEESGVMSKGPIHATSYGIMRILGAGLSNVTGTDSVWLTSTAGIVQVSDNGIWSNGKVTVSSYGNINVYGEIINSYGKGVTLTSSHGGIVVNGNGVVSKGAIQVTGYGDVVLLNKSLNNLSGTDSIWVTSTTGSVSSAGDGLQSNGKIYVHSHDQLVVMGDGINNKAGTGVDLTSTNGWLRVNELGIKSKGSVNVTAALAVAIINAGINNAAGTGNVSITCTADSVVIADTGVISHGKVRVQSFGKIHIYDGSIDNRTGKGVSLTSTNSEIKIENLSVLSPDTVSVTALGNIIVNGTGIQTDFGNGPVALLSHTGTITFFVSGGLITNNWASLQSDKLVLLASQAVLSDSVIVFPANNNTGIDLGGSSGPGVLGITNTELNYFKVGWIITGDLSNTSNITVSRKIADKLHYYKFVTKPAGGIILQDSLNLKEADFSRVHRYSTTLLSHTAAYVTSVTDSVVLGSNTVLDLSTTATGFEIGNSIKLIDNRMSGHVSGTFKGLPQNKIFSIPDGAGDSVHLKISYTGGDGNDVVVTVSEVIPAVKWDDTNPAVFDTIAATTATAKGNITAINGGDVTNRGAIVYPYTGTDKVIGDAGTTNFATSGVFSTGIFPVSFTGLTPDTRYNARVHATNAYGTGYSARTDFRTQVSVPGAPTVNNPTATSLDVTVIVNGNPLSTKYAIQDSVNNLYVKADGTRGADTVWQTAAAWGTKTVTGLATGTTYYFRVKARNSDKLETAFSRSTGFNTCANPVSGGTIGNSQRICKGSTPVPFTSLTLPSGYGGVLTYKWQYALAADSTSFTDITNTDSEGYTPGALTATKWYRRLSRVTCKPDWTGAMPSNVIRVLVDPITVGGAISGDTLVCYGNNTTLLTLSGQTGTVQKWQYSTNGSTWIDMNSQSSTTYTAVNLITDTWYRAVVKSGNCLVENSAQHKIRMISNYKISGYAKYENNPHTPLNGLKITLRKNGIVQGTPVVTPANGYYEFTGLVNGTYNIQVSSADPSGNWQTWGGVNNTDYLLTAKHAAGTSLLSDTPPVIRVAASVKLPLTLINTVDADAIKKASTFGWGNPVYFDIPKWVFSGVDQAGRIDTFALACANVTRDIRALCAGDVNGSYVPANGYKMAEPSLELVNRGTMPVTREMVFPVTLVKTTHALSLQPQQQLGAITLTLDFNPALIEITGVEMPENGGTDPWFNVQSSKFNVQGSMNTRAENLNFEPSTLNLLQIGWMSLNPVNVVAGQPILLIHARLVNDPSSLIPNPPSLIPHPASLIRFNLHEDQLNELADGYGNVIDDGVLTMPDATLNSEIVKWRNSENGVISVYPNPASSILHLDIQLGQESDFRAELVTMAGILVKQLTENGKPGLNRTTMDLQDFPAGVYMLRVKFGDQTEVRKVVINR